MNGGVPYISVTAKQLRVAAELVEVRGVDELWLAQVTDAGELVLDYLNGEREVVDRNGDNRAASDGG